MPGPPQQVGLGGDGRTAERFVAAARPRGPLGTPACSAAKDSTPSRQSRDLGGGGCLLHWGGLGGVFPPGAEQLADVAGLPS